MNDSTVALKDHIRELVAGALARMRDAGETGLPADFQPQVERARNKTHGDYACNAALALAKAARRNPRELAEQLLAALPASAWVGKVEIAGPGFLNFFVTAAARYAIVDTIRSQGAAYGRSRAGGQRKVNVEFVSANPTGPLHVGHGRGAAFGDALVRVLNAAGFSAHSEYYVNDAGRQMSILALSVWLRYLALCGETLPFPGNAYRGAYIMDLAVALRDAHGDRFKRPAAQVFEALPEESEALLDTLIERARTALGADDFRVVFELARNTEVDGIREDLSEFRVAYDTWFSEQSLVDDGSIERALQRVDDNGYLYRSQGALWFRSTAFGDEKDRVVRRATGTHTYFAADIAYLLNKIERGFEHLIYVWGADHHGMVTRLRAAYEALGIDDRELTILLVQFAVLYRGAQKVSMSTRSGEFVTLRELREEVGNDAARFFYVLRKPEQHMDFDLELAKSQSNDNPVYYVQYAHARICSVFRQLREKGLDQGWEQGVDYALLVEDQELDLLAELGRFPEIVESAAGNHEPHQIAYYLRELATRFHVYYNAHPFIGSEARLRGARLGLIDATRQVIANGLGLLGVSAPDSM